MIGRLGSNKLEKSKYKKQLEDLENLFGDKILRTRIDFHNILKSFPEDIERLLFSRKTSIYSNFSELVDEILEKLNLQSPK